MNNKNWAKTNPNIVAEVIANVIEGGALESKESDEVALEYEDKKKQEDLQVDLNEFKTCHTDIFDSDISIIDMVKAFKLYE